MFISLSSGGVGRFCLLILAALLTSLGAPNFLIPMGVPFASFIGATIFFYYLNENVSLRSKYQFYLIFSCSFFIFSFHWLFYTLGHFGGLSVIPSIIIGFLFAILLFPQVAIYILFSKVKLPSFYKHLLSALVLIVAEKIVYPLFPFSLGDFYLNLAPYIGMVRILGSVGFAMIFYYLVLVTVSFIKGEYYYFDALFVITFILANILLPLKLDVGPISRIKMVQGNINNTEFLTKDASGRGKIVDTYIGLSIDGSVDLIIWPESAYPYSVDTSNPETMSVIKNVAEITGAKLVTGVARYDHRRMYNSIISSDGEFYDKQILVPFGEYLPFLGPYWEDRLGISSFNRGESFTLFKLANGQSFIAAVCYEILFPLYIKKYLQSVESPSFIVNVANDDWYGNTGQRYEHRYLAHLRSVEFNIPIVRVTNTGITQILYPDGTMSEAIGVGMAKTSTVELDVAHVPSVFERYSFRPLLVLFLLLVVGYYLEFFLRKRF
jgi:apolipoprotein N-acyltransferase